MTDIEQGLGPLAAALAKAQADFGKVTKDKEVVVQKKTGGTYKFSYAPLDTILDAVRKPLAENGLVVLQLLDDGALVTMLLHESGARLSGSVALPDGGDIQGFGSAITYLRRYALQALLGIAAEDDDDGNRAAGNDAAPSGEETLELLGNITKAAKVAKGTAEKFEAEWNDGADGHQIGVRFNLEGDERHIPQVHIKGSIGEALWLATGGDAKAFIGQRVTFKGKLYNVRQPGRTTYLRLVIGDHPDSDFIETNDYRIPAPPSEPPAGVENQPEAAPEAESVPLFEPLDAEERALVGGGLP